MKISIGDLKMLLEEIAPASEIVQNIDKLVAPGTQNGDVRADQIGVKAPVKAWNLSTIKAFARQVDARLKPYGWFVSEIPTSLPKAQYRSSSPMIWIRLQPETGVEATDVPSTIFHVTTTDNVDRIKSTGLVPKKSQENVRYAPRVYVATSREAVLTVVEDQATRFIKAGSFSIIVMKRPAGIKFFLDPEFGSKLDFVYTTESIPSEDIINVIDVSTEGLKRWRDIKARTEQAFSVES